MHTYCGNQRKLCNVYLLPANIKQKLPAKHKQSRQPLIIYTDFRTSERNRSPDDEEDLRVSGTYGNLI